MTEQPRIAGGVGADDPYWDALERGDFVAPKCNSCNQWMWPAHYRCGKCGSWEIAWKPIEPSGVLYTWTRNHAVSEVVKERRADTPFVTLLVELPQAGSIRIPGVLEGSENGLAIGAPLRGRIRPGDVKSKGYTTMVWSLAEGEMT